MAQQYAPMHYPPAQPKKSKLPLVLGGLLLVALGVVGTLFGPSLLENATGGDEVLVLEPASEIGINPFSSSSLADLPDPTLATATKPISGPSTVSLVNTKQVSGSREPGLYGGSGEIGLCYTEQIKSFLASEPEKAAAWVEVLAGDPTLRWSGGTLTVSSIPQYIDSLTPVVLMSDTRVTNHGFKNGKPMTVNSLLQRGTAVLVDEYGVPRVKCNCGNPLKPAADLGVVKLTGTDWAGRDGGGVKPDPNTADKGVTTVPVPAPPANCAALKTEMEFAQGMDQVAFNDAQTKYDAQCAGSGSTETTTPSSPSTATTAPLPDAPVAGNPTITPLPAMDCGGGGFIGYTVDIPFTDANADMNGPPSATLIPGRPYQPIDAWAMTGDSAAGTISLTTCAEIGTPASIILVDGVGNNSNAVDVVWPDPAQTTTTTTPAQTTTTAAVGSGTVDSATATADPANQAFCDQNFSGSTASVVTLQLTIQGSGTRVMVDYGQGLVDITGELENNSSSGTAHRADHKVCAFSGETYGYASKSTAGDVSTAVLVTPVP